MDASVQDIWTAARGSRFAPAIGKETHFTVGFSLVLVSVLLAAAFTLKRSVISLPLLGIPSSAALAFGVVYMFCAVGVYI